MNKRPVYPDIPSSLPTLLSSVFSFLVIFDHDYAFLLIFRNESTSSFPRSFCFDALRYVVVVLLRRWRCFLSANQTPAGWTPPAYLTYLPLVMGWATLVGCEYSQKVVPEPQKACNFNYIQKRLSNPKAQAGLDLCLGPQPYTSLIYIVWSFGCPKHQKLSPLITKTLKIICKMSNSPKNVIVYII